MPWFLAIMARPRFQSSAAPKGGCNPFRQHEVLSVLLFQSSAAPKGGCNTQEAMPGRPLLRVSILSRPEGRLQRPRAAAAAGRPRGFNPQPPRRAAATAASPESAGASAPVSILSRPEGRLQRASPARSFEPPRFQSSAAPKGGCNVSSAEQKSLCPPVSILSRPEGRLQRGCRWRRGR